MRVLLVGATSYVASFFVEDAVQRGWEVFGISHDRVRQRILCGRNGGTVTPVSLADAVNLGPVDAIVNFAYPKDLGLFKIHAMTRRIVRTVNTAARRLSPKVVVQVSTKAVFGYSFTREPRPVPVWWATGDGYIETKLLAEMLFLLGARGAVYVPVILRLGNVIGPGASWVSEVAQRVLFGRPVGRGKANATYARNVADYLAEILVTDAATLRAFGPFHHLAEFSSHSWASVVGPIAEVMGLPPAYRDAPVRPEKPAGRALVKAAARHLSSLLPDAWQDRMESLYGEVRQRLTARGGVEDSDADFHPTLHQPVEFRSHALPGWRPRFSFAAAVDETVAWVRDAGYGAGGSSGKLR